MMSIIQEIRGLESFERFLLGPSDDELLTLASKGPIVVFNVAPIRSDALLITSNGIKCLPLLALHYEDIAAKTKAFTTMLDKLKMTTYNKTNEFLNELLKWLWDVAVGPVLEELGIREAPAEGDSWPHVCWVPCGWLNLLPLHAAGYHRGSTVNALDRVISSYVPNLKTLSYARNKDANFEHPKPQEILFVSMPRTPGRKNLPYAANEIKILNTTLPTSIARSSLEMPIKNDVIQNLRTSQFVHFACHGSSNFVDPSQSHLLLTDWQNSVFSVTDIIALNLVEARLIYLSACHAAKPRVERLFDEGITIAGACLLAGFPHVIGTIWSINDSHSAKVAKSVYSAMLTNTGELDVGKAAEGLHAAVRGLRDETAGIRRSMVDDPLAWAPYIYLGA